MKQYRFLFSDQLIIVILMATIFISCQNKQSQNESWVPLFNGKNLDGWVVKFTGQPLNMNYKNTFRVEDGILKVCYNDYDSLNNVFGHLITKESFSHYKIRAEYRFIGDQIPGGAEWAYRNNGIMIHCQPPQTIPLDQDFPVSIEVQLLGGNGNDERPNMNVCTPGTMVMIDGKYPKEHCCNSTAKTYHGDQWVTVEVEVQGDSVIKHLIDGEVVLQYEKPLLDPESPQYSNLYSPETGDRLTKGHIALQAESHPTEFRKVDILILD